MAGLEDMIRRAERSLGISGRPNGITEWYSARNGRVFARAAWCDQSITFWAFHSGNHDAVCFGRDYAYTVWHAQRFSNKGQWHAGTGGIRRGDIVFFDWAGSRRIPAIDHIALVTGVRDGIVFTIEGNTSDGCRRRARRASSIVGYGRPNYTGRPGARPTAAARATAAASAVSDRAPSGSPVLKDGSTGGVVRQLQLCLNKVMRSGLGADGEYGPKTAAAVKAFQKKAGGLTVDGEYGPNTARKLHAARDAIH
jgi:Putative peptidoglycan binding domain/CHAP domain